MNDKQAQMLRTLIKEVGLAAILQELRNLTRSYAVHAPRWQGVYERLNQAWRCYLMHGTREGKELVKEKGKYRMRKLRVRGKEAA